MTDETRSAQPLDGPTVELWADLVPAAKGLAVGQFASYELRLDGEKTGLYMGIGHDGSRHLFLPVEPTESETGLPIRLNGLQVAERRVILDDAVDLYLDVESSPTYQGMFTLISREIAERAAVTGIAPRVAARDTVARWRAFWRTPRVGDLSRSQQIGLFGEVWFLGQVLIPRLGPQVVYRWAGPHGERHDFQGLESHVEVKVTERAQPVFRVSGLDQLDPPEGRRLGVAAIRVREEAGGSEGLVLAVRKVEVLLKDDVAELDAFRIGLATAGYRPDRENDWDKLRLRIRAADTYEVGPGFPRLNDASFVDGVPPGVQGITYAADLTAQEPLDGEPLAAFLNGLAASEA